MIEIKVPTVGESISEVSLAKWLKKDGEWVERDEVLAEMEREKATFEINAEQAGVLHIIVKEGETLAIGDLVCKIDDKAAKPASAAPVEEVKKKDAPTAPEKSTSKQDIKASPGAAAIIADKKIDTKSIAAS